MELILPRWMFVIALGLTIVSSVSFIKSDAVQGDEICDNAIDDDDDGLIDLNDPDCTCEVIAPESLFPNPSFEEMECCPRDGGELKCATGWDQASAATTDYIHSCGWLGWDGEFNWEFFPPPVPFPDGEGIIGFRDGFNPPDTALPNWKEYAGACLLSTMKANNRYKIAFDVGFVDRKLSPPIELTIFGTSNCDNLPFGGQNREFGCPTNGPGWVKLGSVYVNGGRGNRWIKTSINITPREDIRAVALGPSCEHIITDVSIYYFLDNLILDDFKSFELDISGTTHPCRSTFTLKVNPLPNVQYQWYKDGIALIGETTASLKQMYGEGNYQVRTGDDSDCKVSAQYPFVIPTLSDSATDILCEGELYSFGTQLLSEPGIYSHTFKSKENCDSTVILTLEGAGSTQDTVRARVFSGRGYEYENQFFSQPGEHLVTLVNSKGCDSLVLLILEHYPVYMPSAFSPNNDGVNEIFSMIAENGLIQEVELTVFNRLGKRVFQGREWDGTYKGKLQLPGVYVYLARARTFDGNELQLSGTVTLLR